MKYAILALYLLGCAAEETPTDQPVAGSVAVNTQAFSCKIPVYDVITRLGVLCQAIPTPPQDAWGQTLFEMKCSQPIYYWTGQKVSTGVRYSTVWSVWTEFSKSLSNRTGLHTLDGLGNPKKVTSTLLCDVVKPTWVTP